MIESKSYKNKRTCGHMQDENTINSMDKREYKENERKRIKEKERKNVTKITLQVNTLKLFLQWINYVYEEGFLNL